MNQAHLLQSGFLAWVSPELVKIDPKDVSFKTSLYTPEYQVVDSENYYDKGVESLHQQWRKDNTLIQHFEFREAIILTALRCFREKQILPWVRLQLSHTSTSYLHRKFLKETFDSALRNMPKTLDNFQYYRLLQPVVVAAPVPKQDRDMATVLGSFFPAADATTNAVLYQWTVDLDGVIDLLSTLHVIFGRRSGPTTVAERQAV